MAGAALNVCRRKLDLLSAAPWIALLADGEATSGVEMALSFEDARNPIDRGLPDLK